VGSHRRRSALASLTGALLLLPALSAPAQASPETLKRAVSNMLFGPFDVATSFIQGPRTVANNIQYIDDSMGVRIAYVIPGVAWNTAMQIGSGIIRTMAGMIEFIPGLGLVFFEADLDPIFAPPERADALVDVETTLLYVKIGVNYVD
jgi:hypothetical protein